MNGSLADNGIENIENLDESIALTTLELANNRISSLSGLEKLVNVDDFWFNGNKVSTLLISNFSLNVFENKSTTYSSGHP